jgi:hypothetical protein
MPLYSKKAGDCRGSEKDGSKSEKFCNLCYEKGKFRQPDMTLEEMKGIVDKALKEQHWPRPLRWLAKKQLPKLERWKT